MKTTLLKELLKFILPIMVIPTVVVIIFSYVYEYKMIENNIIMSQEKILLHIIKDIKDFIHNPLKLTHHINHEHLSLPEISVYDKDMKLLVNNFGIKNSDEMDQKYDRKILEKHFKKVLQSINDKIIHDKQNALVVMPVVQEGKVIAYITSGYKSTVDEIMKTINLTFFYLFFIIIFMVIGMSVFVVIFSLKLLHPLNLLVDGIKNISTGDLSFTIDKVSNDEIGTVVDAFNDMLLKRKNIEDELRYMATHDGLTGLYNHKFFYIKLEEEIQRAERYQHPVSLLLLDIDHFKVINDTYGHRSGDIVLRHLSDRLVDRVRTTDFVFRYGGEEITILLPETDSLTAKQIAEDLRILIEQEPFEIEEDRHLNITVSIGVSTYPQHAKEAAALVSSADKALYEAKDGGRNRVCVYQPQETVS